MWTASQFLVFFYFWLDTGANTCGIDYKFKNCVPDSEPRSATDANADDETNLDIKILKELFTKELIVHSTKDR